MRQRLLSSLNREILFGEPQMSKRKVATKRDPGNHKPATTPKRPKVAARTQRKKEALIRSPTGSTFRDAAAGSTDAPMDVDEPKAETPIIDNRARAAALEAILRASMMQNEIGPKLSNNIPGKRLDFFLPAANVQAYQAKFLEVTQANFQFSLEFFLRLARVRSPLEFWAVIAEFSARRILAIGKDAKDLAGFWRTDETRDLPALTGR